MHVIDGVDASILLARDESPDATIVQIAELLGISRNTVHARLKRLERGGALGPASSRLEPSAVGRALVAFVTLSVAQRDIDAVYDTLRRIPEVIEAHTTTGDADLMVRVAARDTGDLHRITQLIQLSDGVHRSSTVLATTEVIAHRLSPLLREMEPTSSSPSRP